MNIFLKCSNKNSVSALEDIKEILNRYNHTFTVSENDAKKDDEKVRECDLIITVGGDGTLLSMNHLAIKYNKPILGINLGRLGFLTAIEGNQLNDLCRFFDHPEEYEIKKHSLLFIMCKTV